MRCLLFLVATAALPAQRESFERMPVGAIASRKGTFGTWTSDGGAEVSTRRANTGKRALRLFGGKARRVSLELAKAWRNPRVQFWAERWTRRNPFELVVEARWKGTWRRVYRDRGKQILVGGYLVRVDIDVSGRCDALRWTCTSPNGSGILIDDVSLEKPAPMVATALDTEQPVLPVLLNQKRNRVARLRIVTKGQLKPIRIAAIRWSLRSSGELRDIAAVHVEAPSGVAFGKPAKPAAKVEVRGQAVLQSGVNDFWITVDLNEKADLAGFVDAGCIEFELADGAKVQPVVREPAGVQRYGVAVRDGGQDGVHTYRIPGLTTTDKGTLIGVYDVRHRGGRDLPGDIDVGMSRSTDGGRTWEPMRVIMDMGKDPKWRYDGVGDPAILFDEVGKTIWVAATWSHGNRSWFGSGPGLAPEETGQLMLAKSSDDGRTWSKPINITKQVKDPSWCFVLQGPGRGITMADGTLVFGAQFQAPPDQQRMPYSTILWSKDRGATWSIGAGARPNTTECQPVELTAGRIMLNMRDNRRGSRAVMVTDDLGKSWREHPTHRKALVEPTCNAGLLKVRDGGDGQPPWLAFVNPAVAKAPRRNMTIKLSTDGGMTWPASQQRLLDSGRSAGYPSPSMVDAETVGVLYESSRAHLVFQVVRIPELLRK